MKYIIEIEEKLLCVFDKDTQTYFPRLWRVKGFNSLVFDEDGLSRLEELNSDYINENFGDLQDDAYERGHEIGYQKGFEDGKAQREHDDKIEVGDEVKPFQTDITGVVTLIDGDTIYVLWRDGSSTSTLKLKEVTKTGRHFDIASILEDMRHD